MKDFPNLYHTRAGYEAVMAMYDIALTQGPMPYETKLVETRHGQTHVVIGGRVEAPPVLLFHGWNGNASSIGADFAFLFKNFRVYMPDIIGHPGKSAPNRPATAGSTYADWANDVLEALGIKQINVIGISGGGWMTLKFAAYYSHRITRAIALSADGLSETDLVKMLSGMLPVALFPNATTARWFLEFVTAPTTPKGEQATGFAEGMRILLKNFKTQQNPGVLPDEELRRITTPLIVLMGEYERIFKARVAIERAKKLIPSLISAEIVPNAGHLMTADQPEFLEKRVTEFFNQG